MECRICDQPSMPTRFMADPKQKKGKLTVLKWRKEPYIPTKGTTSFVCGLCVAHGRLREEREHQEVAELDYVDQSDLKTLRKVKKLTQAKLAEYLGVSQPMVNMVEKGEKIMPKPWMPLLAAL